MNLDKFTMETMGPLLNETDYYIQVNSLIKFTNS
jgi:hypothetical protein